MNRFTKILLLAFFINGIFIMGPSQSEEQKNGPPKIFLDDFHNAICFKCHTVNDFSPHDKTQKQWRCLIEANGHAIFAMISWETSYKKKQILEFLLKNAGPCREEGIGLWN